MLPQTIVDGGLPIQDGLGKLRSVVVFDALHNITEKESQEMSSFGQRISTFKNDSSISRVNDSKMLLYEHAVWQYRKENRLQTSDSVFGLREDDQHVSRNQVQKEYVVDSFATEL